MLQETAKSRILSIARSIVIFILGGILGAIFEEWWGKQVIETQHFPLITVIICLAIVIYILVELLALMMRLYNKVGIKVRYVDVEKSGEVYRSLSDVVKKAEKSIYVVNSYLVEGDMADMESIQAKTERNKYYNLLLEKAKDPKIVYVRIIQNKPDGSTLKNLKTNTPQFEHLKKMIEQRRKSNNIFLLKAPALRLTTFLIVDNKHLIWQINEVNFNNNQEGNLNLHGAFIIHDPMARIIGHFIDYFKKLQSSSREQIKYNSLEDELI